MTSPAVGGLLASYTWFPALRLKCFR